MNEFRILLQTRKTLTALALGGCLLIGSAWCAEPKLNLFTAIDAGRIENGYDRDIKNTKRNPDNEYDPSGMMLLRNYVNVGYTHQLDEYNLISIGVGGVFWKAYERKGAEARDKFLKFGPGISHAYMKYTINDNMDITYGLLNYKYNSAAKNLGEYLFRTEAYPTIVYTGGWSWMNSAAYSTIGGKFTWNAWDGILKQDLVLFMEFFNPPIYDITPAYIATWKPAQFLTFGGAVSLHRLITPTPEIEDVTTQSFEYVSDVELPEQQNMLNIQIKNANGDELDFNLNGIPSSISVRWDSDESMNIDSAKQAIYDQYTFELNVLENINSVDELDYDTLSFSPGRDSGLFFTGLREDLKTLDSVLYADTAIVSKNVAFDIATTKFLGFFKLDFRTLLGKAQDELGDFNIYGEVALLGTSNYPIFYTEYSQRLVKMLGISIPVPFVFDHLSFEMEHLKNPTMESIKTVYDDLEVIPDADYRIREITGEAVTWTEDDFKWTVHASRKIGPHFTVYFQVANDHLRLKSGTTKPMYIPVTQEKNHLYWLTRFQWSI
jgi:hypothetical protein